MKTWFITGGLAVELAGQGRRRGRLHLQAITARFVERPNLT